MLAAFLYVEHNVVIPSHWLQLITKICPRVKDTDIFHYHNLNGCAYCLFVPVFYLWKAINHDYFNWLHSYAPSTRRFSISEAIVRLTMIGLIDYGTSRTIPRLIFGTHILNYYMDFIFKKSVFITLLTTIANSPIE
jgi:hypothetical protein